MALANIRRDIVNAWPDICERADTDPRALESLPKQPKLLGSSYKTELASGLRVLTAVVYMSPDSRAFRGTSRPMRTLCAWAGQCSAVCLGHNSGMLAMSSSHRSQLWKTTLFLGSRWLFVKLADAEIVAHHAKAKRKGMTPAVRIDGTSDTGYGMLLAKNHPEVTFYDYTKDIKRLTRVHTTNYHLVYSYSEKTSLDDWAAIPRATRVAVVFNTRKGEPFPKRFRGRLVVNGDAHDAVFLQPLGIVLGLSFKAAADRAGHLAIAPDFVQAA